MSDPFWLTDAQMERLQPDFPKTHADAQGRPITLFVTAGPVRDCSEAAALLRGLRRAGRVLADRDGTPTGSGMR